MKILSALIVCFICSIANAQNYYNLKTRTIEPVAMQADFKYLKQLLTETHPGLYRYNSKEAMQAKFDSTESLLKTTMPFLQFYRIIEALIADIHCAHTYALPVKDINGFLNNSIKTLPFFVSTLQDKTFVLFNCTTDKTIEPGAELLSINGKSMKEVRRILMRYYWADGHIEVSKLTALHGQFFAILYYSIIGQPDTFHLSFKKLDGDTVALEFPAQTFGTMVKMIRKNPVNAKMNEWYNKGRQKHPWRLSFPNDVAATAMLRFDSFGGEGAKNGDEARTTFRAFMDKSLAEIEQRKCTNLIIDVGSNSGGWDNQGVELFTYLMKSDSAVKYYRREHAITNSSEFLKFSDLSAEIIRSVKDELIAELDGTFTLKEEKNPSLQLQYPKPNRFKGTVYFLTDEKTFSTAAEFTAAAHYNKLGTFVGEETAGAYSGGNGGSFIHLELPNSKISIGTPLLYYQMNVDDAGLKGRGTIPDYKVSITLDDVLSHTNSPLEYVKKLIRN